MGMQFTERQQRVVDADGHNILVSAAAGSGKTAVLTARIARMISDSRHPVDIDRLLVVTFTRAAAAEMRDRIGKAVSAGLARDPANRHLQAQETLLQRAQITTIDSFCNYVLRNNFSTIDLDPGFRLMDQTESELLRADVMDDFLEEKYGEKDPRFLACLSNFCADKDDTVLGGMIRELLTLAESHPQPDRWLRRHREDYKCQDADQLETMPWMQSWLAQTAETALGIRRDYDRMLDLCRAPGGPYPYEDFLRTEQARIFSAMPDGLPEGQEDILKALKTAAAHSFEKLPSVTARKYPEVDQDLRVQVKDMRDRAKKSLTGLADRLVSADIEGILAEMRVVCGPVQTLFDLTMEYGDRLAAVKKDRNIIDFSDLEHYALRILTIEDEDGHLEPSPTAMAYRKHFHEIMIDEYQDSNEVQEVLLSMISGEDEGRYNRFMVGDVKQSIYKFRLARPEIFMDKFDRYRPGDSKLERIDLDLNFRSRPQVLDSINAIFRRIMRREIGGIDYTEEVSLKAGAQGYVMPGGIPAGSEEDPYRTELLFVCTGKEEDPEAAAPEEADDLSARQKEASVIAARIREMVGHFPLSDGHNGLRPARYGDIVILLRSAADWNEDFREILEKHGIPVHVESRTGYFGAQEILVLMQLLRVLLNPRQDLYLYGVMHGFFGGFSENETALVRAACREGDLYDALVYYGENGPDPALSARCGDLLARLRRWRDKVPFMSVTGLLNLILEETGYATYCAALPAGEQRSANLQMLLDQADAYDRMGYAGLFRFLRYIDSIRERRIDLGEANTLDEKADVVRIMTIHKSKGLEFPICIVAGLAKRHSYMNKDTNGPFLTDSEWGVGVDLVDTEDRTSSPTIRKNAVALKIMRESLGEELRVLYVAMTRAKEKLILSMQVKSAEKTLTAWKNNAMAWLGSVGDKDPLPPAGILSFNCFGQLIYAAILAETGLGAEELGEDASALFTASVWPPSALTEAKETENLSLMMRRDRLMALEADSALSVPEDSLSVDADLADRLRERLERRYAREDLKDLYVKTSVSELKHEAMDRLAGAVAGDDDASEGAVSWFGSDNAPAYVPAFAAGHEDEQTSAAGSATAYGTAVHRFMECADLLERESLTGPAVEAAIQKMRAEGLLTPDQADCLPRGRLRKFFGSSLAARMEKAERAGRLYREQPFVLGIPADRLRDSLPHDETVMIQGVIDVWFREDDHLVLADYKTDRVPTGEELIRRYKVQMDYYTEALERITGLPVKERILYAFSLGEEVRL